MVITIELLVTVAMEGQVALGVIITVIVDGLANKAVTYVEELAPKILTPFLCH